MSVTAPDPALLDILSDVLDEGGNVKTYAFVNIVNTGIDDFKGQQAMYGNQEFPVPANGQTAVPYFAMCLWMGDPRTVNVPGDPRQKYREDEWRRLRTFYGIYDDVDPLQHPQLPRLQAWTLKGERIITVLDDPFGEMASGKAQVDERQQMVFYQKAYEETKAQLARLEARMDSLVKSDSGLLVPGVSPETVEQVTAFDKAFSADRDVDRNIGPTAKPAPVATHDGIPVDNSQATGPIQPTPQPATKNIPTIGNE